MPAGEIISIFAIIVAFVIGFKEQILSLWYRPKLKVTITNRPPDCHKTAFLIANTARLDCFYYRLNIHNTGRTAATDAEVVATRLSTRQADGSYRVVNDFLPQNLLWSFIKKPVYGTISPKVPKHCDLGHVSKSPPNTRKGLFEIEVGFPPMNRCHVLGFGIYRLEIIVAASNVAPLTETVEIDHSGEWFDDEDDMLDKGTKVHVI